MAGSWRLVVRSRGQVERAKFSSAEDALEAVEARGRALERTTRARPVDTKLLGRFEPAQQVAARLELSGPGGLRAGVDVHGDGSVSAFSGRVRRRALEAGGSSAYDALRRAVMTRS